MPLHSSQRGMTLVAAMLLLVVITILGVGMFHSFGIQERIAGNTREKQRALHAAESAEVYAEWWLTANQGANATIGIPCVKGTIVSGDTGAGPICSNTLTSVAQNISNLPLNIGGVESDVTYTPPGVVVGTNAPNVYFEIPRFYISYVGGSYNQQTGASNFTYTIDSLGYGGTANSMAEVESTYVVNVVYTTQAGGNSKWINLGGP
jgi:type IV pilus assembly protein PilX